MNAKLQAELMAHLDVVIERSEKTPWEHTAEQVDLLVKSIRDLLTRNPA